jgi:aspartate racemase
LGQEHGGGFASLDDALPVRLREVHLGHGRHPLEGARGVEELYALYGVRREELAQALPKVGWLRRANKGEEFVTQHIGIVAGSAEGAALCYRTICLEAPAVMGEHNHPEITMNSMPMAEQMPYIRAGDWEGVAGPLLESARKVARAGADFAICPDNTYHQAFEYLVPRSPIPWLHIAEAVGEEAQRLGFKRLGILGTKYLAEGPVYPATLKTFGIEREIPEAADRERINDIIFKELVNGLFPETSRLYFNEVTGKLKERGCDAVVLGCTEIPLIVRPDDCPLPTLDSTRLLARAALRRALES